jgi:hypothetical protein
MKKLLKENADGHAVAEEECFMPVMGPDFQSGAVIVRIRLSASA